LTDIVRDWADNDGQEAPIHIDAVRKFVEDDWGSGVAQDRKVAWRPACLAHREKC
jgi:hypothetical protein